MPNMKFTEDETHGFAELLSTFFLLFDGLFMNGENIEELLKETKRSLEEKANYNESALPVIIAMGGRYDGGLDRAKIEEIDALIGLLEARKAVRDVSIEADREATRNAALRNQMFGI